MQNGRRWIWLLLAALLVGCGGSGDDLAERLVEVTRVVTETVVVEGEAMMVTRVVVEQSAPEAEDGFAEVAQATPAPTRLTSSGQNAPTQPQARLIIKNGVMTVVVAETNTAVDDAIRTIDMLGGYIISQSVFNDDQNYRYATLKLAVPVARFEEAMRALRGLGTVANEAASGTDVTDEFVDLNSRLTNLEATRDRLRTFLEQATNVEETLQVNEELKQVEEEIAIIQGRINFLADRAAFSTIDLTINPFIPTPTPSPTATATPVPTATPLPTPQVWRPGDTAKVAAVELQDSMQGTADFLIYNGIVCGPWLLLAALLAWGLWRLVVRFDQRAERLLSRPVVTDMEAGAEGANDDEQA